MLRVLMYHRVADATRTPHLDPALVSATSQAFREQMEHVARRYRPVSLDDIVRAFGSGDPLPAEAVHVTVDDAYTDFQEHAWPVLRELGIPVTVFVPTDYPGRPERAFWWDRLHAACQGLGADALDEARRSAAAATGLIELQGDGVDLRSTLREMPPERVATFLDHFRRDHGRREPDGPRATVLDWDQLRALQRDGVTFGAHTHTHCALSRILPDEARAEIRLSLDILSRELGAGPRALAYPYGMYNDFVARMARDEGCCAAFTCDDGLNAPARTDPFRLRRTNITPRTTSLIFTVRMLPWFAALDRWRNRHQRARLSA